MMDDSELYQLIWLSRPVMQAAERLVEQGLQGSGLTVRTRAVLEILALDGDLTVPDIADRLFINRQYVQLMVNDTLAAGLTQKRANPRHRRSALIGLTGQGQDVIARVIAAEQATVRRLAGRLDPAQVGTALEVTRRLLEMLQAEARG